MQTHISLSALLQRVLLSTPVFSLPLILVGLCGCSLTDGPQGIDLKKSEVAERSDNGFLRSPQEALAAVTDFVDQDHSLRSTPSSNRRVATEVIDLTKELAVDELRSSSLLTSFADNFYIVPFDENKGFSVVSKDKRCFPIYAILDNGAFNVGALRDEVMLANIQLMLDGAAEEVSAFNTAISSGRQPQLRKNADSPYENTESAIQDMRADDWMISRTSGIRMTSTWVQHVVDNSYISKEGKSYNSVYPSGNVSLSGNLRSSASTTDVFGCTPVAFGQVMYALRDFSGFRDLKYSSGEPVLWDKMDPLNSLKKENQRFLGWITANCHPTYFKEGTMVRNIDATNFLRNKLGDNIYTRYDNCVSYVGDFDGYGWSEDKKVSEDFFSHPNAFVIMTAARGVLNLTSYHTFVIDGMVEFHKRVNNGGFLGTGLFSKMRDGVRHLYHVNAGWGGASNGYYLYVQNIGNKFKYVGKNNALDYRANPAYVILWPNNDNR